MKKILSIFMSVVMLLSITAGADLSAQASGWLDNAKEINFGESVTDGASISDYHKGDTYYDAYYFEVPANGTITITLNSNKQGYIPAYNWTGLYGMKYTDIFIYSKNSPDEPLWNAESNDAVKYGYSSARDIYYCTYKINLNKGNYYYVAEYYAGYSSNTYDLTISFNPTISKPSNIKVSSSSSSGFNVNWSKVANVDGYLIKYATKSDFSNAAMVKVANGKATSKTINGRAANTKYYVKVQAYKKVNGTTYKSKWSETKAVRTLEKKNRITSITGKNGGFTVKWEKMNGKLGYQIRYATRSDFSNAATIYAGNGNAASKTVTGRARKTKYYVQVRSYVKQSNGKYKFDSWSPAKTVTTK